MRIRRAAELIRNFGDKIHVDGSAVTIDDEFTRLRWRTTLADALEAFHRVLWTRDCSDPDDLFRYWHCELISPWIPGRGIAAVPVEPLAEGLLVGAAWEDCCRRVPSQHRIGALGAVWDRITDDERAEAFAECYSSGDLPSMSRAFVLRALNWFEETDRRVFDGKDSRGAFDSLDDQVRVFRGGVVAERPSSIGTSWTLDRDRALWFALDNGRFRNTESRSVIFSGTIPKHRLRVVLFDRGEREVVLDPDRVVGLNFETARRREEDSA
jgi:hypothetical protein